MPAQGDPVVYELGGLRWLQREPLALPDLFDEGRQQVRDSDRPGSTNDLILNATVAAIVPQRLVDVVQGNNIFTKSLGTFVPCQ